MKPLCFDTFKKVASVFNETSAQEKLNSLTECAGHKLSSAPLIKVYHNALLFTLAYPENEAVREAAAKEMARLSDSVGKATTELKDKLILSGIANSQTDGAFSLSLIKWLLQEYGTDVELHSFDESGAHPKDVLKYVFPEMEFEILADEKLNAQQWLTKVSGTKNKHSQLRWLIDHVHSIQTDGLLKDQLFESMRVYVSVHGNNEKFSRSFGNLNFNQPHFHTKGILKKFDEQALINKKLPLPKKLNKEQAKDIINSARTALALLNRETDPVSYCNEDGLLYYELEHGLSIALFSMLPERRLPLESYVGFMMYKNGYPMAYGGGWLFGHRSLLGINIFEAFRGGESAFVFAQLLRSYKQAFGAEYFEVEPYQFGKNNPEGLQSGAFWFYYRFGFRPMDKELYALSSQEAEKIATQKGYRSSIEILKKFTAGNVAVNFSKHPVPLNPSNISKFITAKIISEFGGNRNLAERRAKKQVADLLKLNSSFQRENSIGLKKLAVFIHLCIDTASLTNETKKQLKDLLNYKSDSEFEYIKALQKLNLRKLLSKECLAFISY